MKPSLENHELCPNLSGLKSSSTIASESPPSGSARPIPFRSNRDLLEGTFQGAPSNEFIEKHQTFYNNLFHKIKLDSITRPPNSTSTRESTVRIMNPQSAKINKSHIEEPKDEVNFIRQNIEKVIQKPQVKNFKYLMDDQITRRTVEPRRLIKGLDELYGKINKLFANRITDDDASFMSSSHKNLDTTDKGNKSPQTGKPPKKVKRDASMSEKKNYSNLVKEHKMEPLAPDSIKKVDFSLYNPREDKLEISYENCWKRSNAKKLPQIRSSSQPRSTNFNPKLLLKPVKPLRSDSIQKDEEDEDPLVTKVERDALELYRLKIIETRFKENDPVFDKIIAYIDKGSSSVYDPNHLKSNSTLVPPSKLEKKTQNKIQAEQDEFYIKDEQSEYDPREEVTLDLKEELAAAPKESFNTYQMSPHPSVKSYENKAFIFENLFLNENMCRTLGKSLSQKPGLSSIILVNNRVDDLCISALMEQIMTKPTDLEIFRCINNSFGENFTQTFEKKFFSLGINTLKELTLDGSTIFQIYLARMFDALTGARSRLRYLGLCKVGLNEMSLRTLGRFIKSSQFLTSLDLSWNSIKGQTMELLVEALNQNYSIKHLNLCQNSLSHRDNKIAKLMKDYIASHNELVHINLAFTCIEDSDALLITEGVQSSKSMLAVHLDGNNITSIILEQINILLHAKRSTWKQLAPLKDSLKSRVYTDLQYGFTVPTQRFKMTSEVVNPEDLDDIAKSLYTSQDSEDTISKIEQDSLEIKAEMASGLEPEPTKLIYSRILDRELTTNEETWSQSQNCWICERWKKIHICYNISKPKAKKKDNDYSDNKRGPSIAETKETRRISQDLTEEDEGDRPQFGTEDIRVVGTFTENKYRRMMFNNNEKSFEYSEFVPPGVHYYKIDWIRERSLKAPLQRLVDTRVVVRARDSELQQGQQSVKNSDDGSSKMFVKERSVFADFTLDNDDVLRRAFEADIKRFKLRDLLRKKSELDRILLFLFKNFKQLKSIFLHYSATAFFPNISYERFLDCLEECGVLTMDFRRHDAIKTFNLTKDLEDLGESNQGSLKRFEFIEALLRMALMFNNPKGIVEMQADAVEKFMNECILPRAKDSEEYYTQYRIEKVYTAEVEAILKANIDVLEKVFKKRKQLFGIKVDAIKETLNELGVTLPEKDLMNTFAYSKMTVVDDERDNVKCLLLNFVEFLEFFVRLADICVKKGEVKDKLKMMIDKAAKIF